MLSPIIIVR